MDILTCFYNNGYLFKCLPCDFDNMIINTMKSIILINKNAVNSYFHNKNVSRCIICFQYVDVSYSFKVCKNCCNCCIGKKVLFEMSISYIYPIFWYYDDIQKLRCLISFDRYRIYFPEFRNKDSVLTHFVNNSFKLKHRFYHEIPIILLLSIYDPKSSC